MDFTNRSASRSATHQSGDDAPAGGGKKGGSKGTPAWLRITWIVLLFSVTIVLAALAVAFSVGGSKESEQVDANKQQAVFLTNGQVYFGKISDINSKYIDLRGIYYLNVSGQTKGTDANQQPATSSISLVKLGCELHGPADQMLINRDQVTFWENLKDDGQVAKAIAKWVSENPNGQTCQTTNS